MIYRSVEAGDHEADERLKVAKGEDEGMQDSCALFRHNENRLLGATRNEEALLWPVVVKADALKIAGFAAACSANRAGQRQRASSDQHVVRY